MAELLKIADAARLLNVSRGTVRRWIRSGYLPSIRLPGGQYRITTVAAEALMVEVTASEPEKAVA